MTGEQLIWLTRLHLLHDHSLLSLYVKPVYFDPKQSQISRRTVGEQ